jgi:DNA methylase
VLDCFIGSGTTAAVAEKLNRRWIACDLGRFAIHTTRKRLLGIPRVKPFVVQNLGKYERQQWQVAEFAPAPVTAPPPTVILSEGVASRSEATPQSKDPIPAGAQRKPGRSSPHELQPEVRTPRMAAWSNKQKRGPSTPQLVP